MANQFAVSVADAIGRDSNGNVLFLGKANMSSAFTMTTARTDVRGGINNPLLYTYYHDREVAVSIESAVFTAALVALNAGTSITNGTYSVVKTEAVTLSSGSGTLTETPVSATTVGLLFSDGTIVNVTPSGTTVFVAGKNENVTAMYTYSETLVDQVVGYATTPPSGIELILTSEIRNASNVKVYDLQIIIPNFNISGNYNISLAADGVSSQTIEGAALVEADAAGDYYFKANWIPSTAGTLVFSDLAMTPSVISFSAATKPDTYQITTLGIRGGLYANVNVTTSASYARTSGSTSITVGSGTGLVTATSAVANSHVATITGWYWDVSSGSLSDTISVIVGP
jgi:hypothetical protein